MSQPHVRQLGRDDAIQSTHRFSQILRRPLSQALSPNGGEGAALHRINHPRLHCPQAHRRAAAHGQAGQVAVSCRATMSCRRKPHA